MSNTARVALLVQDLVAGKNCRVPLGARALLADWAAMLSKKLGRPSEKAARKLG